MGKKAYSQLANFFGTSWKGKKYLTKECPFFYLTFHTYRDLVILHRGYDPNLGILHGRTKGGGFLMI